MGFDFLLPNFALKKIAPIKGEGVLLHFPLCFIHIWTPLQPTLPLLLLHIYLVPTMMECCHKNNKCKSTV